jgi:hypothetical protein
MGMGRSTTTTSPRQQVLQRLEDRLAELFCTIDPATGDVIEHPDSDPDLRMAIDRAKGIRDRVLAQATRTPGETYHAIHTILARHRRRGVPLLAVNELTQALHSGARGDCEAHIELLAQLEMYPEDIRAVYDPETGGFESLHFLRLEQQRERRSGQRFSRTVWLHEGQLGAAAHAPVSVRTSRARGAGRPRGRTTRSCARSGDSGPDGSDSDEPGPGSGRPLLLLAHPRFGRVNPAMARALRGLE